MPVPEPVRRDDTALVEAAAAGSHEAISDLYERYWPLAWQWAYLAAGSRTRADDLAQDAVVRAFAALARFDPQRPFGPWLKRILVNKAIDDSRKDRRVRVGDEWMADLKAPVDDVPAASGDVVDAVRTLAPARREVIVLHYWLDLPVDEIAALLGLPFGTVASRLSRALADLRVTLEGERV
jgi:RNA polymerase sigma-70 factor, ECF subfamily